jgi:hypothetical protein
MPKSEEFSAIFKKFKAILKKYEKNRVVEMDTATDYFLNFKKLDQKNKPIFFAGASINKISVSFYLKPVYEFPQLLEDVSPELRNQLHGKCCFRFKKIDPAMLKELSALTKRSVEKYP